jgi:hypothetical protein
VSHCSKPGCANPGTALLGYDYAAKQAYVDDPPQGEPSPHSYVLCTACAGKLNPPRGWDLIDRRAEPPLFLDDRTSPAVTVLETSRPDERRLETQRRQLFFGSSA